MLLLEVYRVQNLSLGLNCKAGLMEHVISLVDRYRRHFVAHYDFFCGAVGLKHPCFHFPMFSDGHRSKVSSPISGWSTAKTDNKLWC